MRNPRCSNAAAMRVENSSGNIFADIGLPIAEELLARSKVIGQIHDIIKRDRLTDAAAAKMVGIPVADVDTILRGDVEDKYSKKELRLLLSKLRKVGNGSENGKRTRNKVSKIRR